ncbi:MAG: hypothetical protein SWH68_09940 [Thermodesulfobacteriota bacterium]|nr:hypothetical protein [Thermodesulfobacteriota bacterium]
MISNQPPDGEKQRRGLAKLFELMKSLRGKTPDYDNLDFSNWHQSEESYQKEQAEWLKTRKKQASSASSENEQKTNRTK